MDLFDIIRARKSVRTYDGRVLAPDYITEIENTLVGTRPVFKGEIHTDVYTCDDEAFKVPSTYGVIKGARTFLIISIDEKMPEASSLAAGYIGEAAVLRATQMGVGTCWLGGTFSRKDFAPNTKTPPGFKIIAVIPVGYPAEKSRFMDRMMRSFVKADRRKPFAELFFGETDEWADPLEAVRLAPSSTNSQPWRVVCEGNRAHFFYKSGVYSLIDMGIAMYHFDAMTREKGIEGFWSVRENEESQRDKIKGGDKMLYLATYTKKS